MLGSTTYRAVSFLLHVDTKFIDTSVTIFSDEVRTRTGPLSCCCRDHRMRLSRHAPGPYLVSNFIPDKFVRWGRYVMRKGAIIPRPYFSTSLNVRLNRRSLLSASGGCETSHDMHMYTYLCTHGLVFFVEDETLENRTPHKSPGFPNSLPDAACCAALKLLQEHEPTVTDPLPARIYMPETKAISGRSLPSLRAPFSPHMAEVKPSQIVPCPVCVLLEECSRSAPLRRLGLPVYLSPLNAPSPATDGSTRSVFCQY